MSEITHQCPPEGSGLMPCCGRTPLQVPDTDRLTLDPALVTCPKRSFPDTPGPAQPPPFRRRSRSISQQETVIHSEERAR